jgi:hypothetical protein
MPPHWAGDLQQFDALPTSLVASHDRECCVAARRAILSELLRRRGTGARLAAVPEVLPWSPLAWPVTWCELLTADGPVGDCGVHAFVASLLMDAAGVPHSRVSAAILPAPLHREHWHEMWRVAGAPLTWIGRVLVYHEVVQVGSRLWDPSEVRWFDEADPQLESGRVVALRSEGGRWRLTPSRATAARDLSPATEPGDSKDAFAQSRS